MKSKFSLITERLSFFIVLPSILIAHKIDDGFIVMFSWLKWSIGFTFKP